MTDKMKKFSEYLKQQNPDPILDPSTFEEGAEKDIEEVGQEIRDLLSEHQLAEPTRESLPEEDLAGEDKPDEDRPVPEDEGSVPERSFFAASANTGKDFPEELPDPEDVDATTALGRLTRPSLRQMKRQMRISVALNLVLLVTVIALLLLLFLRDSQSSGRQSAKEEGDTSESTPAFLATEDKENSVQGENAAETASAAAESPEAARKATVAAGLKETGESTQKTEKETTRVTAEETAGASTGETVKETAGKTAEETAKASAKAIQKESETAESEETKETKAEESAGKADAEASKKGSEASQESVSAPEETEQAGQSEFDVGDGSSDLDELKDRAVDLRYKDALAKPEQYKGKVVIAGGKVTIAGDGVVVIVDDYKKGGMSYYQNSWYIKVDKLEDAAFKEGQIINFYGYFLGLGEYRAADGKMKQMPIVTAENFEVYSK